MLGKNEISPIVGWPPIRVGERGGRDEGELHLYTPGSQRPALASPNESLLRQPCGLTPELASSARYLP